MGVGRLDAIEVVFLLCFFAVPAWGVIDAARIPASAWRSAGRSKRFWILIQLLTLYLGAVAYVAGVRRDVLFFSAPRSTDWDEVEAADEVEPAGETTTAEKTAAGGDVETADEVEAGD